MFVVIASHVKNKNNLNDYFVLRHVFTLRLGSFSTRHEADCVAQVERALPGRWEGPAAEVHGDAQDVRVREERVAASQEGGIPDRTHLLGSPGQRPREVLLVDARGVAGVCELRGSQEGLPHRGDRGCAVRDVPGSVRGARVAGG